MIDAAIVTFWIMAYATSVFLVALTSVYLVNRFESLKIETYEGEFLVWLAIFFWPIGLPILMYWKLWVRIAREVKRIARGSRIP